MTRAARKHHRQQRGGLLDGLSQPMNDTMIPRSPLDDPATAAYAWARYRRLMRFMSALTVFMVAAAFVALYRENGLVSAHLYVATAIGVGFTMLLTSALMGLVFLSHGTGHDDAIVNPLQDGDSDEI